MHPEEARLLRKSAEDIPLRTRKFWYGYFDLSIDPKDRVSAALAVRLAFARRAAESGGLQYPNPEITIFLDSLPDNLVITPVMAGGFCAAGRVKNALDALRGRDHGFAMVGYSTGRYGSYCFRDGSSIHNQFFTEQEAVTAAIENRSAFLLVDEAIETGETLRTVARNLIKEGATEVHAIASATGSFNPATNRISEVKSLECSAYLQ